MEIKALFFDVDGTLYTHRVHDFPQSTKKLLWELKKRGYKVGVATSRCRYETKHLPSFFREFDFDAEIYDGGALIMEKDEVLAQYPIPPQQMEAMLAFCVEEKIPIRYSTFADNCFAQMYAPEVFDRFFRLYLNCPHVRAYTGEPAFNVLAYTNEMQIAPFCEQLANVSVITHRPSILEITAKDVNKSSAIAQMCKHWQLPLTAVACFGDGANDVQMLKQAGLGVAMGNGGEQVKAAADLVCAPIDEDGLYKICKQLQFIE